VGVSQHVGRHELFYSCCFIFGFIVVPYALALWWMSRWPPSSSKPSRKRIRKYLDEHPLERNCAQDVGGLNKYGGVTEEFIIASAEFLEDLYCRHLNNWNPSHRA
jgi:hypothetical protein